MEFDNPLVPGSPAWWVERLKTRLEVQRLAITRSLKYYNGEHDPLMKEEGLRPDMLRIFRDLRINVCELVVDIRCERLEVQGFRFGEGLDGDQKAMDVWRESDMTEQSARSFPEVVAGGHGAISVWYDLENDGDDDAHEPRLTFESPYQVVVETDPSDRRKVLAALKSWVDSFGIEQATLYLPDTIYRLSRTPVQRNSISNPIIDINLYSVDGQFTAPNLGMLTSQNVSAIWVGRDDNYIVTNTLGEVPVYPLENRPKLTQPGKSEIADIIGAQDALNMLILDMVIAADSAAFLQKWATGLEIPTDEEGNEVAPFRPMIDRILQSEDPNTKFGQFAATPLANYGDGIREILTLVAASKRIPAHYLLAHAGQWPTGDALRSAEIGLVKAVQRLQRGFGDTIKRAMQAAFKIMGDTRDFTRFEVMWAEASTRSESERADALVKRAALGVPYRQLWLDAEYSETQCDQFEDWIENAIAKGILAPLPVPAVDVPGGLKLPDTSAQTSNNALQEPGAPAAPSSPSRP